MKKFQKIPLAMPLIGRKEISVVTKVLKSGQLSLGPYKKKFEESFTKLIGTKYAVAVNSGTSGLHLAVKCLGLKPGDEVITSPFSFVASSNPIIFEQGKPVFVDIDEKTYNMNPELIEDTITEKTRAIMPVHIFGQPCDMDPIMETAEKHNLSVIEDACESLGAEYKGRKAGTFGLASVFAFYPNKQITTGEGGMVVTNNERAYKLVASLSNQGRSDDGAWLNHVRIGYNYRLDEMSCALGFEQLKKIRYILKKRGEIAKKYTKKLSKIDGIITPYVSRDVKHSWFVYSVRFDESINRDAVMHYLEGHGIATRPYFYPAVHMQPIYRGMFNYNGSDFPVCEKVSKSSLILPFFVQMSTSQIERVCRTLENAISEVAKK